MSILNKAIPKVAAPSALLFFLPAFLALFIAFLQGVSIALLIGPAIIAIGVSALIKIEFSDRMKGELTAMSRHIFHALQKYQETGSYVFFFDVPGQEYDSLIHVICEDSEIAEQQARSLASRAHNHAIEPSDFRLRVALKGQLAEYKFNKGNLL